MPGQPFIQGRGGVGGCLQPLAPPPTTLPCLAAAGRGGGEHFPGIIRGGAVKPPELALPHCPTVPRPRRPGERDREKPTAPPWLFPPPSSAPSSPSDNGSTGKWPNPGSPRSPLPREGGAPAPASPSPQRWVSGQPHWKRGAWQRAEAGTPGLCCPPAPNAAISPIQSGCWLPPPSTGLCPGASAGKRQGRGAQQRRDPQMH